jgi:hypothetical protein
VSRPPTTQREYSLLVTQHSNLNTPRAPIQPASCSRRDRARGGKGTRARTHQAAEGTEPEGAKAPGPERQRRKAAGQLGTRGVVRLV